MTPSKRETEARKFKEENKCMNECTEKEDYLLSDIGGKFMIEVLIGK